MMFVFTPWRHFRAFRNRAVTTAFMKQVATEGENTLRKGILSPPKTGRIYKRKRGSHQASVNRSAAEYPANDTGALAKSVRKVYTATKAEIGTNMFYSKFLRNGTRKMERRKMSDTAMKLAIAKSRFKLRRWAGWRRDG